MSWSDGGCARVHNPGKRWHVAKAGDGRRRRADQATRMREPIGFRRRRVAGVGYPGTPRQTDEQKRKQVIESIGPPSACVPA